MKFQLLIAKKFMLGGAGSGPSRLNGWISIIGMIIGAFAILISLSVMNGFEKRVIEKLIGFEGDIRITSNVDNNLEKIFNEIQSLFPNSSIEKEKEDTHTGDPSGKSIVKVYIIYLTNGRIQVTCTDWAEHTEKWDTLKISIS